MSGPEVKDTPMEAPLTLEQRTEKLEELKASATREYALKNFDAAAEYYSEAAEVQDEINGEMSPENANLLYLYGRCLYHVAVRKSDVLGGKVASAEEPKRKKRKVTAESSSQGVSKSAGVIGDALKDGEQKFAQEVVEAVIEEKNDSKADATASSKPFFQITGDDNWTDSEEEDEDAADAAAEEEEDDFAIAYEILDVARVLLSRKAADLEATAGKETSEKPELRLIKERLADTHDLQAEISLENERFHDAINDTRDALNLKMQLYPEEDSLVAEAHFKLSLALEFASVTQTTQDGEGDDAEKRVASVDETMRAEAASEMDKAIASTKLRISKEKARLPTLEAAQAEDRKKTIADVEEMVADMEQRLVDLRNPAVSLTGGLGPAGAPSGDDPMRGILGAILGESKIDQQQRVAEATATANDLTGLVKKKKAKTAPDSTGEPGKGKRKAEDIPDSVPEPNGKKAKVEDE